MTAIRKVNLAEAFSAFEETWSPRVGDDINEFQIKLAKFAGPFYWHHHDLEDELFLVIRGRLRMRLREQADIVLGPRDHVIVPHGVEHCPTAEPDCDVILFERNTTLNTGNIENERTARVLARV